jgi:cytochrome c biogenesis protein CcdA
MRIQYPAAARETHGYHVKSPELGMLLARVWWTAVCPLWCSVMFTSAVGETEEVQVMLNAAPLVTVVV